MSDSDQLSGESSVSLFSGLGTSSISGTSETAHLNIEELSDSKLDNLLEEQKRAIRTLILESIMFENFFERLVSGQVSFTPSCRSGHQQPGGSPPRKGSGTLSDTVSNDSDSQPPTSGTSLLDVSSHTKSTRHKRSNSRTSLGSRGKSLRLSNEQKIAIAMKELERISRDLDQFRKQVHKETVNGMASILEYSICLQELAKNKWQLSKQIAASKMHNKKEYNFEKLQRCFNNEIVRDKKHLDKLKTKNGVLLGQIKSLQSRMRLDLLSSQETGPVNLEQLQLENSSNCSQLDHFDRKVVEQRRAMVDGRRRKSQLKQMSCKVEKNRLDIEQRMVKIDESIEHLEKIIPDLQAQCEKKENNIQSNASPIKDLNPSVDDYLNLKIKEIEKNNLEKRHQRQEYLRTLAENSHSSRESRSKSALGLRREKSLHLSDDSAEKHKSASSTSDDRRMVASTQGKLIRGKTFNLEFRIAKT